MTALTSTRSVFQTMLRSFSPTSPKDSTMSSIFLQPSSNVSYTASALSTMCKRSAVSAPGHSQGCHATLQSPLPTEGMLSFQLSCCVRLQYTGKRRNRADWHG